MSAWANTVLTDKGRSLMAKLTQGNTLEITRAVTGAGFVTPGFLAKQTDVTDPKQELTFRPVSYPETGKCAITTALKNEWVLEGYMAVQVGIYAEDPDEGEVLFFIAQATDATSGTIIPDEHEMPGFSAEWTFYLQYGQADSVQVTVDPSNTVTRQEMEEYVAQINPDPEIVSVTLSRSGWVGTEAPYTYTIAGYDGKTVEVVEDVSMTMDQLAAIESAKIKSDPRSAENILYAFGEKPTIDVPVLFVIR